MSDLEFDVMDELYFIQSFEGLMEATGLEDKELRPVLEKLLSKGWIRCFRSAADEVPGEDIDLQTEYMQYLYLASKSGLMAHNSSN